MALLLSAVGCVHPREADSSPQREETAASPASPSSEQQQLLTEAQEHEAQGQYPAVIRTLQFLLEQHPTSSLVPEARFALARAFEQSGHPSAALETYRSIIRDAPSLPSRRSRTERQAANRIAKLEAEAKKLTTAKQGKVGVFLSPSSLPPAAHWPQWLQSLQDAGVSLLLLEIGTKSETGVYSSRQKTNRPQPASAPSPPGVYFQTVWAPVSKDLINQLLPLARAQGLAVYGAVTLRNMPWLQEQKRWTDRRYRIRANRLEPSRYLDLFNPEFQEYCSRLLEDLARTGLDGLLFRSDAPLGPYDGLSRFGLDRFYQQYGIRLDARSLFAPQTPTGSATRSNRALLQKMNGRPPAIERSPTFWRWSGWKAWERMNMIGKLIKTLQDRAPFMQFALEVHPEAFSDPVSALYRYAEDVLEAKQVGIHHLLTTLDEPITHSDTSPNTTGSAEDTQSTKPHPGLLSSASQLIEDPEHIWLSRPLAVTDSISLGTFLPTQLDHLSIPKGVGLIYIPQGGRIP